MAYKDKIYDITAWDMSKRLELFLNKICGSNDGVIERTSENEHIFNDCRFDKYKIKTLGEKIKYFCAEKFMGAKGGGKIHEIKNICEMMDEINKKRNSIVHPKNLAPVLTRGDFKTLQKICFEWEYKMKAYYGIEARIKEVLPTLEYDMGNAGDIIKHGLLVEFIEWWGETNPDETLQIADTFAGCPWDNMSDKIHERLELLEGTRLSDIQLKNQIITDAYLGSSLLMLKTAIEKDIPVHIDVSDKDDDARCNWRNVEWEYKDKDKKRIKLICPGLDKDEDKNNGYNILNSKCAKKYDLILLDPYSEFLRDEFYSTCKPNHKPRYSNEIIKSAESHHKPRYFTEILKLVESRPNLFIAVFVLDLDSTNRVGEWYAAFKESKLRDYTFSLRCSKIPREKTEVTGESKFDSEILLISQQIADKECGELRKRLTDFAEAATKALRLQDKGVKKVEFWPNE